MDKSVGKVDKSLTGLITAEKSDLLHPILGIFAKEPVAGQVKTRLCPPLKAEQATELYRVMLKETVTRMRQGAFDLVLFYSGHEDYFRSTFPGLRLCPQAEGDLGQRLEQALGWLLKQGAAAAALIGSDSPDFCCTRVEEAFAALTKADCVTAGAADGGYVLIGERRHHPELFCGIPWSTPQVLAATRNRANELAISYREMAPWEDVDDLASLKRLVQRSPHSATAQFALTRLSHCL